MAEPIYLTANQLCQRYGVCRRTIGRWSAQADLAFPAPSVINGRRYWRMESIASWEAARAGMSQ